MMGATDTAFDPEAFKADQRTNWNHLSSGWDKWFDMFEAGAAPATAMLLDSGRVTTGSAVLDIGTGTGEPALSAARRVGPQGRVVGVDQAADMLAVTARRAGGLPQLSLLDSDAEALDLPEGSFDTVLSRWGLMFLPDRAGTLAKLLRLLRSGGRLAAAVWPEPPRVPLISLAFDVIGEELALPPPPPGLPGPFSMADTARDESELAGAGFTDVVFTEVALNYELPSVESFVEFSQDLLPRRMSATIAEHRGRADDPALWSVVAGRAKQFVTPGGHLVVPCTALCLHATKPE